MRKISIHILVVTMLILGCVYSASAETVIFKSALVWRGDSKGNNPLPVLVDGLYQPTEGTTTDGYIKSITANWKFSGVVLLEVSADGGLTYALIINGVTLNDGFGIGNNLRWRARIGSADSKLQELKINYTTTSDAIETFGQPKLSGFKFRKPLYINPSNTEGLLNYQIKIKVGESENAEGFDVHCSGRIRKDFQDVRFTAPDGETILPYYLESITGRSPNQLAIFWVKIPQIPAVGITPYIYYGNKEGKDLSNPNEVFDFFDDFSQKELDKDIWGVKDNSNYSLLDSQLKLTAGKIISKTFKFTDGIIEYSAAGATGLIIRDNDRDGFLIQSAESSSDELNEHCIKLGGFVKEVTPKPITEGTKYSYRIIVQGGQITFQRYDVDFKELQAEVNYNDVGGLDSGYLGLQSVKQSGVTYDWIKVRKGIQGIEPSVDKEKTANAKEQEVDLPVFTGMTLAENGALSLADTYNEGIYISKFIPSAFPVLIIVPAWQIISEDNKDISVSISAEGGSTYKQNCVNEAYYYVSRKDFISGNRLRYQLKFSRQDKESVSAQLEKISLDYRPGKITLFSPNGGESWGTKTKKEISWMAADYEATYPIKLEYSIDSGKNYASIIDQAENTGTYIWTIPEKISNEVMVRICDAFDNNIYDASDNAFAFVEVQEQDNFKGLSSTNWNDPANWGNSKIPSLNTDVVIDNNITIYTQGDIKFRTLIIGDGTGKHESKLILTHNIDPRCTEITIRKGGVLVVDNAKKQVLAGNLTIKNGGILTHSQNIDSLKYKIDISALDIMIEKGAKVSADGKGYIGSEAGKSGKGEGAGNHRLFSAAGTGGSYGGLGGRSRDNEARSKPYGLEKSPQGIGSSGGGGQKTKGGAGGGLIRLDAKEDFLIYGEITANGEDGGIDPEGKDDGGGGAGGTIHLSANRISGEKAKLFAFGGKGHLSGGGGAGGRLYLQTNQGKLDCGVDVNGGAGFGIGDSGSMRFEPR